MSSHRTLTVLALLLTLPSMAQESAYHAKPNPSQRSRAPQREVGEGPDEAWGRYQWWLERMGGPLGAEFTQHLLDEAAKERAKYPGRFQAGADSRLMPAAAAGSTWLSLGPTTSDFTENGVLLHKVDSGRPRTILPDTADATGNTVYLLTAGGGLWKTSNFLSATPAWTPLTDFIGSNVSGAAAFGRVTSTLYVGAGDPFDPRIGGFMVKSTNSGSTWTTGLALASVNKILDIKVDTSQAQDIVLVGTDAGLFRSIDGGSSYASVASLGASAGKVWSLVRTSAGWLASTEDSTKTGTLYLSADRGATWSPITNAGNVYAGAGRTTLAVGQPGGGVVYAFAANTGDGAQLDLFKSTDGGQTWVALNITGKTPTNPNSDQGTMDLMGGQAWYNHMILVDPSNTNIVYLGGQLASAKTTDGGGTWTLLSDWLPDPSGNTKNMPYVHADFHCAAYSNLGGTPRLYFGTDGGLFTSADGGTTWDDTKNKGLVTHLIYSLAANVGVTGSALVGLQDNGTRIRSGTTSTFNQVRGGDGFGTGWSQANNAVSLASYVYNDIVRSTTNPVTDESNWNAFTSGLGTTDSSSYYFVTPIVTPPATADVSGQVFFTYGNNTTGTNSKKIFKSSSTGWTTIGTVGTGGLAHAVRGVSHGVGISPVDLQHIAVAGYSGFLPITTNGGGSWTEAFLGAEPTTTGLVPGWQGFNSNIAWASNTLLYVCSEAPGTGATRVAKSANGGSTWTAAASGLPDVPVTKLAVDLGDATGNTVYAATWLGIYKTVDGGTSWTLFGAGLPQGQATDIWVAPDSSVVRVSTWGRGVWELTSTAAITVALDKSSATLAVGASSAFTATLANTTTDNTANWTATAGAFSATNTASGVATTYTAPATVGNYTVTATSAEDGTTKATAAITTYNPATLAVTVTPGSKTLLTGGTQTFTASVTGAPSNSVAWSANGGSITPAGVFTAPAAAGTFTITATAPYPTGANTGTATVTVRTLDLNNDTKVDAFDLLNFAKGYGPATGPADFNGDNAVDDTDLGLLLNGIQ